VMGLVTRIRRRLRRLPQHRWVFPNTSDSSATPASSSVAVVHLWPKVSTPSRSSRRFLFVLPFNLQFRGRSHLILFALLFLCLYCLSRSLPSADHRRCRPWFRTPPPIPTPVSTSPLPPPSVLCLTRTPRPPSSPATRAPGALELLTSCTSVPGRMEVEDKVVLRLGSWTFL
jgi:hypothetical protein